MYNSIRCFIIGNAIKPRDCTRYWQISRTVDYAILCSQLEQYYPIVDVLY